MGDVGEASREYRKLNAGGRTEYVRIKPLYYLLSILHLEKICTSYPTSSSLPVGWCPNQRVPVYMNQIQRNAHDNSAQV